MTVTKIEPQIMLGDKERAWWPLWPQNTPITPSTPDSKTSTFKTPSFRPPSFPCSAKKPPTPLQLPESTTSPPTSPPPPPPPSKSLLESLSKSAAADSTSDDDDLAEPITPHYAGIILVEDSVQRIMQHFPPRHSTIYAHHMTIKYKPSAEFCTSLPLGKPVQLYVEGGVCDDYGQAVHVQPPSWLPYENDALPHVTMSVVDDVRAEYSKWLLEKAKKKNEIRPFTALKILHGVVGVYMTDGSLVYSKEDLVRILGENESDTAAATAAASDSGGKKKKKKRKSKRQLMKEQASSGITTTASVADASNSNSLAVQPDEDEYPPLSTNTSTVPYSTVQNANNGKEESIELAQLFNELYLAEKNAKKAEPKHELVLLGKISPRSTRSNQASPQKPSQAEEHVLVDGLNNHQAATTPTTTSPPNGMSTSTSGSLGLDLVSLVNTCKPRVPSTTTTTSGSSTPTTAAISKEGDVQALKAKFPHHEVIVIESVLDTYGGDASVAAWILATYSTTQEEEHDRAADPSPFDSFAFPSFPSSSLCCTSGAAAVNGDTLEEQQQQEQQQQPSQSVDLSVPLPTAIIAAAETATDMTTRESSVSTVNTGTTEEEITQQWIEERKQEFLDKAEFERQAMQKHLDAANTLKFTARTAYDRGNHQQARENAKAAKIQFQLAAAARKRASEYAYNGGNCDKMQTFRIDLHHMYVEEAIEVLNRNLNALAQLQHPGGILLRIITGIGKHSEGNAPKILPAVVQRLSEVDGIVFDTETHNPGVIRVIFD